MKIYVAMICDRHDDPEPHLFSNPATAIQFARRPPSISPATALRSTRTRSAAGCTRPRSATRATACGCWRRNSTGALPMQTDPLIAFVEARLAEDEETARRCAWTGDDPEWTYDRETFAVASTDRPIVARRDTAGPSSLLDVDGAHIARHDPARVLREVQAKRRLLDRIFRYEAKIDGEWGCCHDAEQLRAGECPHLDTTALELLAAPYVGHPDFDPAWLTEEMSDG